MREPGRWAHERGIYDISPNVLPCCHCDIPIALTTDDIGPIWIHCYVPSAYWFLCPEDPQAALDDGDCRHAVPTTKPEPYPLPAVHEAIAGLQLIEADLR